MRFSKLRLTGFKSFVDPTDLVIADGLTGVVGPNGCGKSNLLEALRWVMGETRAKAMRGSGMEDVIFAGSGTRPARNFAEVTLQIDNSDRLAPAGFNDTDTLDIIRRITRDVGSAYKANGKDVRARDVQMLFADASTGAHSPSLVRQGQIAELINAKPKARRRILEEAAGISGLYQRRHEAELKLRATETNLTRVDDVLEQLSVQLQQLARQARQAARYREIGEQLRLSEGMLLYRRWREADEARAAAETVLRERTTEAARAETEAQQAARARAEADEAMPPLREEEAIAAAVLQRLQVERDALNDEEARARKTIETLTARIEQLGRDIERETGLNRDAGETIERLEWEARELAKAGEGQEDRLSEAAELSHEAASVLQDREEHLSQVTRGRRPPRRASPVGAAPAGRQPQDPGPVRGRGGEGPPGGRPGARGGRGRRRGLRGRAGGRGRGTGGRRGRPKRRWPPPTRCAPIPRPARPRPARKRSEAEGEAGALRAETQALAKLVARDTAEGGQVLDLLRVTPGYEKALGAALADDLRAPVVEEDGPSGWAQLPGYGAAQTLPEGVTGLANYVTVPEVLARRIGQIGVIEADDGPRLQPLLKPGQRLVTLEGDLWRWDGYRAWAEDAPSAAALRLEQLNRLEALKQELEQVSARAEGARAAHESLNRKLVEVTEADKAARAARRAADQRVADAARALSRAESERNLAAGRLENLGLAVTRHKEDAMAARAQLREAEAGLAELGDLDTARAQVEAIRQTVEASRITMLTRRSAHDELRREGEARTRRQQEVTKEISGWKHRLDTAERRIAELIERKTGSEAELAETATRRARGHRRQARRTRHRDRPPRPPRGAPSAADALVIRRRRPCARPWSRPNATSERACLGRRARPAPASEARTDAARDARA